MTSKDEEIYWEGYHNCEDNYESSCPRIAIYGPMDRSGSPSVGYARHPRSTAATRKLTADTWAKQSLEWRLWDWDAMRSKQNPRQRSYPMPGPVLVQRNTPTLVENGIQSNAEKRSHECTDGQIRHRHPSIYETIKANEATAQPSDERSDETPNAEEGADWSQLYIIGQNLLLLLALLCLALGVVVLKIWENIDWSRVFEFGCQVLAFAYYLVCKLTALMAMATTPTQAQEEHHSLPKVEVRILCSDPNCKVVVVMPQCVHRERIEVTVRMGAQEVHHDSH
jgi:hypothetical protein